VLARMRAARETESGFTLIELLIVIVILGILSAIVVFGVSGITSKGNKAACQSDQKSVEVATEAMFAQTGAYPAAAADAQALVTAGLLRDLPSNTHGYAISLGAGGNVIATPACSTLS